MAKKKPKKQPKPKPPDSRSTEQLMRDLTQMMQNQEFESIEDANAFMRDLMAAGGTIPTSRPTSPLDQAQELVYQAFEASSKATKVKLARQALDISVDCVDAYGLLAEHNAKTLAEAWALYEAAVKVGERTMGNLLETEKGHFWGMIETRPYMRARLGLAMTLWQMQRHAEATEHMAAMLQLNPNDNQGIRYLYFTLALEMGEDQPIEALLEDFPDDWSAYWKYNNALYAFRKHGSGSLADDRLDDALSYNPHVPPFLLGQRRLPKREPDYYSPGDENEALDYASLALPAWQKTEGALEWLRNRQLPQPGTPPEHNQ